MNVLASYDDQNMMGLGMGGKRERTLWIRKTSPATGHL